MIPPHAHRPDLAEAKAQFLLRLRAHGIRDLAVLRALEAVPRDRFVPHRYADLAGRAVALPIPCGQTMAEPFFVARMVEALRVGPASRVLEIGAGSGYATAILARLAREVVGIERYRALTIEARARIEALGLGNATILWADGLAVPAETGSFDRLLVHGVVEGLPPALLARLSADGILVCARPAAPPTGRAMLVRLQREAPFTAATPWRETELGSARLRPLEPGRSAIL